MELYESRELSYYGGYRTRKFTDIFPDLASFNELTRSEEIMPVKISEESNRTLFYLLYARYGNSHIAYSDENQWKFALVSKIFMYGPTWEKRLEIQDVLRGLTEAEILAGSKAVYNHSYNPSTAPSTSTLEELTTINEQNVTGYKRTKMDAYASLMALIKADVTETFLEQFRELFLTIVAPDYPLLYSTEQENVPNE